jgi:hypothetical protein
MRNASLFIGAALVALVVASCGGNGTPPINTTGTGLDGQLVQGAGQKVTSAVGDGLGGVEVQLVSISNGQVEGATTTTADGRFSFRQLPNGQFLLKLRFNSTADLDGDGVLDFIESFIPITLSEEVIAELTAALDFDDTDEDSKNDALKIDVRLKTDENGNEQHFVRVHRHRHGDTQVDDDGDGDVDEDFDDDDANGLPDDGTNGGGNYPQGPKLRGEIEAISDTSITVDGQTFEITDTTSFRIRGNRNADAGEFEVGDEVQVTSFTNGEGNKVALEIKLKGNNGNGGGGGDDDEDDEQEVTGVIEDLTATSITIDGQTFTLTDNTLFLFEDKTEATFDDFAVGDTVELKAKLVDDEWVVIRVKLEEEGTGGGDDEREITGAIEAIADGSVTIAGEAFVLDANTEFLLFSGDPGTIDDFAVGANVELTADLEGDQWVVRKIKLTDEPDAELEDFNIAFTDFSVHSGQYFYLKVVDTTDNSTVGSVTPFIVNEADFNVSLPGILESGTEYNVDFWFDVDGDSVLDGTPLNGGVDHAWRLTETAGDDGLSLSFMHDTNFTDIRPF